MKALAEEWRKRDREREALVKKKVTHMKTPEDNLTTAAVKTIVSCFCPSAGAGVRPVGGAAAENSGRFGKEREAAR